MLERFELTPTKHTYKNILTKNAETNTKERHVSLILNTQLHYAVMPHVAAIISVQF